MSRLEVSAYMKVRAGRLEGFKRQAAECIRQTKGKDTRTLRYDWFLSRDGAECEIREAYVNSDGLVEHRAHIGGALDELFTNFADDHMVSVFGGASPKLVAMAEAQMEGKVTWYSFLQGLDAEPNASPSRASSPGVKEAFELGAHGTVRPGQLEAFKAQAGEIMRLTREQDTQTLRYDWFLSRDGTQFAVREAYVSEAGLLEHVGHVLEAREKLFRDFAADHFMTVYSEVSQQLIDLMKVHAAGATWFSFFEGLEPSPTVLLTSASGATYTRTGEGMG